MSERKPMREPWPVPGYFVIYAHVDFGEGNGERVFYIGAGSGRRPYDFVNRTPKWKSFVSDIEWTAGAVELWSTTSSTTASFIERELIGALKPSCNVHGKKAEIYGPRPAGMTDLEWIGEIMPRIAKTARTVDLARRASSIREADFLKALGAAQEACCY